VEFQYEEQSLAEQLSWLVRGAARLKALAADTALWLEGCFAQRLLPRGLLEPFPRTLLVGLGLLLPGCLAAWLPGCLAAWLPAACCLLPAGCLAAWLPGCLAAWLPGCLAASGARRRAQG
jgi:hypothetical protein